MKARGALLGIRHKTASDSLLGIRHMTADGSLLGIKHMAAREALLGEKTSGSTGFLVPLGINTIAVFETLLGNVFLLLVDYLL